MSTRLAPSDAERKRRFDGSVLSISRLMTARSAGAVAFLLCLTVAVGIARHDFLSLSNIRVILFTAAILAIAGAAQAMVVLTRNLDISIGAVMALAVYVSGQVLMHDPWVGVAAVPLALLVGMVFGLINGVLVAYARIPAIVATLGTQSIYRGIIYAIANGQEIDTNQLPNWMVGIGSASVLGIPGIVVVAVVVVAIVGWLLRYTAFGRSVYAVGSNPQAAVFYGLPAKRIILLVFGLEGLLAGLAGFLLGAQVGTITIDIATGWELLTLAAAVIGGVSLLGGAGSMTGAAIGALTIAAINNALVLLHVNGYWQIFLQGAVIILAIGFDLVSRTIRGRRVARRGLGQDVGEALDQATA